ncbi:MAG TPA: hypothetical protein VFV33_17850, partial [Gemmatimonadaceae bacterium]|nr:hypothetical protein [Gemmatimonadaceae bacterium]
MLTWKQCRSWLFAAVIVNAAVASAQVVPHIAAGPYKVGFSQVVEVQPSTPIGARPLIFTLFYPVDPAAVTSSTPRPNYAAVTNPRVFPSAAFDQFGYEPSYSGLPVASGGPFPVLLYSHGYGAPWFIALHFAPKLATYGYVVVTLGHFGDGQMHEAAALKLRDGDMKFAIDRLLQRNGASGDLLAGTIDPEKIAAGGWSFGGYNATVLAGGDDNVCEYLSPSPPAWACTPISPDP